MATVSGVAFPGRTLFHVLVSLSGCDGATQLTGTTPTPTRATEVGMADESSTLLAAVDGGKDEAFTVALATEFKLSLSDYKYIEFIFYLLCLKINDQVKK